MTTKSQAGEALNKLDEVVGKLLDPCGGCPWDIKQTITSITGNVLEETYELLEALKAEAKDDICEEAGDVLFQVVFIAHLTQAKWGFGLAEIIEQVQAKMVYRHPHVFGGGPALEDAQAVLDQWQAIKRKDKKHDHLLASVPIALPALQRAHRLNSRAARAGFDWPSLALVREKVNEELAELDELLPGYDKKTASTASMTRAKEEMGDVLLALSNLARHLGFSAEEALSDANSRFTNRFTFLEDTLAKDGLKPENVDSSRLEELWQQAKAQP